ncbi:MAG TPA: hypothetical protein VN377_05635 [Candidatus Thermoplasmatota archaeon]|nr:hypothetical protein [Candidatus Thermoplasmatota archaeon]
MSDRKEVPIGIVVFLIFIIVLDAIFLFYLGNALLFEYSDYIAFFSFSLMSIVMWIDVLLTVLSLIIIPYGFVKKKNWARIFAFVFLSWLLLRTILYIATTGEKTIGYLFFVLFIVSLMYLLSSSVKSYFKISTMAIIPTEIIQEYTYGPYTLYTELVHLRNGKNQIIYFFSKRKPKSGTPTTLPEGYLVEVSKRSGLPYLKKETS